MPFYQTGSISNEVTIEVYTLLYHIIIISGHIMCKSALDTGILHDKISELLSSITNVGNRMSLVKSGELQRSVVEPKHLRQAHTTNCVRRLSVTENSYVFSKVYNLASRILSNLPPVNCVRSDNHQRVYRESECVIEHRLGPLLLSSSKEPSFSNR